MRLGTCTIGDVKRAYEDILAQERRRSENQDASAVTIGPFIASPTVPVALPVGVILEIPPPVIPAAPTIMPFVAAP